MATEGAYGSAARPVAQDPFQYIIEVGWGAETISVNLAFISGSDWTLTVTGIMADNTETSGENGSVVYAMTDLGSMKTLAELKAAINASGGIAVGGKKTSVNDLGDDPDRLVYGINGFWLLKVGFFKARWPGVAKLKLDFRKDKDDFQGTKKQRVKAWDEEAGEGARVYWHGNDGGGRIAYSPDDLWVGSADPFFEPSHDRFGGHEDKASVDLWVGDGPGFHRFTWASGGVGVDTLWHNVQYLESDDVFRGLTREDLDAMQEAWDAPHPLRVNLGLTDPANWHRWTQYFFLGTSARDYTWDGQNHTLRPTYTTNTVGGIAVNLFEGYIGTSHRSLPYGGAWEHPLLKDWWGIERVEWEDWWDGDEPVRPYASTITLAVLGGGALNHYSVLEISSGFALNNARYGEFVKAADTYQAFLGNHEGLVYTYERDLSA